MISLDCGLNPITLPALGKCLRIETIRALSHQRKSMSTGSLCLLIACRTTQDTLIVCPSHDRLIAWNIFTCKTMVKNTKLTSRCLCSFLKVYRTKASMLQFDQIIMMKSICLDCVYFYMWLEMSVQEWPVRTPRPVAAKLAADTPLLTGQVSPCII